MRGEVEAVGGGSRELGQATVGQRESPRGCVCGCTGVRACLTFLNILKHLGCHHEAPQRLGTSKQKTAYEIVVSDWSSDVCSSDLAWLKDTQF